MSEMQTITHLKFLHCSDIHLDTAFVGLTEEKSDERRRELRSSFMRLMQYVRDRGVHVVLISGDLFDNRYATNTTAEVLIREFRNCADTVFVIAPGKCDCLRNNPIYTSGRLPDNVHVFTQPGLDRIDIQEHKVTIYGWAFQGEEMSESPLYQKQVDDSSRINIVCGYADLCGSIDSKQCPVSEADLRKFGAEYYALGSRHAASELTRLPDGSIYCYCGSLECTGFEDPGIGGANLILVDLENGELAVDVKRLNFGHLRFVTEKLDITGVDTGNEIINRISRMISDHAYGTNTALRVELEGKIAPDFILPRNLESDAFGLYFFDLIDKTLPLWKTEHYERDMSAAGEVYRQLLPRILSEDEEESLCAARALRVALAALAGKDLDI